MTVWSYDSLNLAQSLTLRFKGDQVRHGTSKWAPGPVEIK